MSYDIPLEAFQQARARIQPYVRHTPLLPLPALRGDLPAALRLKLENVQITGSFKARGVFNTLLQLGRAERERGVVAASGGNHGAALAYGAWRLGLPATIFLPERASADRVARSAAWGAQVVKHGAAWDDAHARATEHAAATGGTYVHPFDAERTLIGQGTLGLELLDDMPELDCVLIAIGGGGLIAGMAVAIKQLRPQTRIIGVEPTGAAAMRYAVEAGHVLPLPGLRANAGADTTVCRRDCNCERRADGCGYALAVGRMQSAGRAGRRSGNRRAANQRRGCRGLHPPGGANLRRQRGGGERVRRIHTVKIYGFAVRIIVTPLR